MVIFAGCDVGSGEDTAVVENDSPALSDEGKWIALDDVEKVMNLREQCKKERSAWEEQNIKNYQFVYTSFHDSGPVGPAKITVQENEDPVIDDNKSRRKINVTSISVAFDGIDATYDYIERVQQGEYTRPEIHMFTYIIRYNEEYHYPEKMSFSPWCVDPGFGGGGYTATITDFMPLESSQQ
jgi:hypothetical protein